MPAITIVTGGYVFRWKGGSFIAAWKAERTDEHVPDAMISLPGSLNRTRATAADIKRVIDDWLTPAAAAPTGLD